MLPTLPRPVATQLLVIRTAMLLGLVLFGGATWYTLREGRVTMLTLERAQLLGWIFIGFAGAALASMIFLRSRLEKGVETKQAFSIYIIGYAFAEGAALFGGVVWFLGGAREWYVAGLVLMAVSFQVLPVRR